MIDLNIIDDYSHDHYNYNTGYHPGMPKEIVDKIVVELNYKEDCKLSNFFDRLNFKKIEMMSLIGASNASIRKFIFINKAFYNSVQLTDAYQSNFLYHKIIDTVKANLGHEVFHQGGNIYALYNAEEKAKKLVEKDIKIELNKEYFKKEGEEIFIQIRASQITVPLSYINSWLKSYSENHCTYPTTLILSTSVYFSPVVKAAIEKVQVVCDQLLADKEKEVRSLRS